MNILIIYSHPSKESYTFNVLQQLQQTLAAEQWHIEVSDLYANDFQTDMTEQEYEREGFGKIQLALPEDVIKEHAKIQRADCIIFVYPVWWSDCPAKLKGWFDRVYAVGYAYGHQDRPEKMKTVRYGIVICTAGHPNHFLLETGIAQSMENVMLDDRLGKRFDHKEMIILGGTLNIEQVREIHRNEIRALNAKIKMRCNSVAN
ncbi:NAD(P)H-dependent oxidoreductase [Pseudochryseolinea flava]|uniref:Flavodoxin family protein n=1 Tax=Pseudochryseolinea flava TaxID=2059302 RepID=A0A364Y4G1_9BACT|nr:NAD(P)H-dependent oxidoreductase [Pseudochryseolinea flava]RAW01832.1 flavodoxin family protein [Pseudochryseolinea flava]